MVLKEADFKACTIDWLLNKGHLSGDAVLINELPVDNFNRRVDLAVANGKLQAYEIKSDVDNLERLSGQVETYLKFFDKLTIVCSVKHTKMVLNLTPENVEVVELVKNPAGRTSFKTKRRGRVNLIKNTSNFLSYVDKKFLIKQLRINGIACSNSDTRSKLYDKAIKLPIEVSRLMTLQYLKEKYRSVNQVFFNAKGATTELKDLSLLRLRPLMAPQKEQAKISLFFNELDEFIDVSYNMNCVGIVTNKELKAIPRLKR